MSDDIGEMVETERIREIMNVKKDVIETRDQIDRARISGKLNRGKAIELYQRKVRDYVLAIETVLNPSGDDPSVYWTDEKIGEFQLPDGDSKTVIGLQEFLHLPTTFKIQTTEEVQESYRHKPEEKPVTSHVRPPERLIEQAFRTANRAMNDVGFDIEQREDETSPFDDVDDIDAAGDVYKLLVSLDDDGLRELKGWIDEQLTTDPATNGHHE